ncbi:MAG: chemotaxis protein CheW [Alteromonadaceae bacterium]|nr:chemotaxis protein CheW [Alteromonadaceae bacterium]
MSKSLPASKKLMQTYLSELLTEEVTEEENLPVAKSVVDIEKAKRLEKLLQKVSVTQQGSESEKPSITSYKSERSKVERKVESKVVDKAVEVKATPVKKKVTEQDLVTRKSQANEFSKVKKNYRLGSFQAMFFDVAGLTLAVPLIELGGIYNVGKTNSIMGKPDWFKGVMLHRDEKINVVDTALWVMPEKCDEKLKNSLNYKYIIMLSNSLWGLSAENLIDTITLEQDEVKWLDNSNKRPWLAGLVKDRMCALLDVESLIQLLNDGLGIQ